MFATPSRRYMPVLAIGALLGAPIRAIAALLGAPVLAIAALLCAPAVAIAQPATAAAQPAPAAAPPAQTSPVRDRVVLAIGAHAGDMELTTGAVLVKAKAQGARVVLLHLTLGEGGNPRLSPADYGAQKRREAEAVAAALGAEVLFGPYRDGEIPDTDEARRYVADVIRQVKPTLVLTHWRESLHKDHIATHRLVTDAVLLATLAGVVTTHPPHRGVSVWFAENWEDAPRFSPYIYVDVSDAFDTWRKAVAQYEFVGGTISSFPYLQYYTGLAAMRGALARKAHAVAFDIDSYGKRRVIGEIP
ncbi:MAG: PIG-L family deacetylase [Vicinamibacteraceae bacterium]|nr:PIG-L family deacetylase [Vicinamibacteraceae bacterium]